MRKVFIQVVIILTLSILCGISYALLKRIPLLPKDTEIYLLSKKYPEIKLLDTDKFLKTYNKREGILIVDARERFIYEKGHIKGAINIPVDEFEIYPNEFLKFLDKDKNIIVYCEGRFCEQSFKVAGGLLKYGFDKIAVYIDGYPEWEKRGLPCEKVSF